MSENPYGIQKATPADADALFPLVMDLYREDSWQTPSEAKIRAVIHRCVHQQGAIAGVVRGEGGIEASVGAAFEQFDYSDDMHIMVKWFGVAPFFRATDRGARLMNYLKWTYETLGAMSPHDNIPVFLPALTATDVQRKLVMFSRRAPQVGALFAYGCHPGRSFLAPARAAAVGGKRSLAKVSPNDRNGKFREQPAA